MHLIPSGCRLLFPPFFLPIWRVFLLPDRLPCHRLVHLFILPYPCSTPCSYSYFLSFLILALLIVPNLHVVQFKKNPFPLPGCLLLLILILLLDLLIFVFFSQFLGSLLLLILIFPTKYPFPTCGNGNYKSC